MVKITTKLQNFTLKVYNRGQRYWNFLSKCPLPLYTRGGVDRVAKPVEKPKQC